MLLGFADRTTRTKLATTAGEQAMIQKTRQTVIGDFTEIQQSDENFDTGFLTLQNGYQVGYVGINLEGKFSSVTSNDRETLIWVIRLTKVKWI